jgi:hypothetical protein
LFWVKGNHQRSGAARHGVERLMRLYRARHMERLKNAQTNRSDSSAYFCGKTDSSDRSESQKLSPNRDRSDGSLKKKSSSFNGIEHCSWKTVTSKTMILPFKSTISLDGVNLGLGLGSRLALSNDSRGIQNFVIRNLTAKCPVS